MPGQDVYEALKKLFVTDKDGHITVDDIAAITAALDVSDRAARLLGKIYGDQGVLTQRATSLDLYAALRYSGAEIDPRSIRVLTSADVVTADSLTKWGGTALTGRDISLDLAKLQPPSSIGTLADVTAAASATQLIAASTACLSVMVRSLAANTGKIRVGDSNITASRGVEISAGDAVILDIDNVNKVYVYGNAADKVSVTYVA